MVTIYSMAITDTKEMETKVLLEVGVDDVGVLVGVMARRGGEGELCDDVETGQGFWEGVATGVVVNDVHVDATG